MKIRFIYELLDSISSFSSQECWDNSGLNLGHFEAEFDKIYASLELDNQVLAQIEDNSLVITHHPIIFKPLGNFDTSAYPALLLQKCIKRDIKLISMHTNFDKTHLNRIFYDSLSLSELGFSYESTKSFSMIASNASGVSARDLSLHVKSTLGLDILRCSIANSNPITKLYCSCGANAGSFIMAEPNSAVLTGDIKYHDAMMANAIGVSFIDIPHYWSEKIFAQSVCELLQKNNIQAIISESHNPFTYV